MPNPENVNSSIEYLCQATFIIDTKTRACLHLMAQIGREKAFDFLRTKLQLGYLIWSGIRNTTTTEGYLCFWALNWPQQIPDNHSKWTTTVISWRENRGFFNTITRRHCRNDAGGLCIACFEPCPLTQRNAKIPRQRVLPVLGTYWERLLWIQST